jgi:hypothetical protein
MNADLNLVQGIERSCYVVGSWKMHALGGNEEFLGFNLIAEYRDHPPLDAANLPAENEAIFQDRIFRQRAGAFVQETVVTVGTHFDQYLHAPNRRSNNRHALLSR